MKFIIDENIAKSVINFLNKLGYSTTSISDIEFGLPDIDILDLSVLKDQVVITQDRDFGELVFKEGKTHAGIIFLRLEDQNPDIQVKAVQKVFEDKEKIINYFVVVIEKSHRFSIRRKPKVSQ